MRRLVTGMVAVGCVLVACSLAAAQSQTDLQAKIESLEKQVALLQAKAPTGAGDMKMEETRRISREMSTDAAKYADDFKMVWNDGLWFKSGDKFAMHLGGAMRMDWYWMDSHRLERTKSAGYYPNFGQGSTVRPDFLSGENMREASLYVEGTLYKYVDYKVQVDFGQDSVIIRDVYMEMTQIPFVGNVRVGNFLEPFGLEAQTPDTSTTFMERSSGTIAFVPGRSPGIMLHDAPLNGRMTWAIGVFRKEALGTIGGSGYNTDPSAFGPGTSYGSPIYSDPGYTLTGRVTGLPWYENKGEKLAHVGIAYSYRKANEDQYTATYYGYPDAESEYPLIASTVTHARNVNLFGAEAAVVYGPFSMQSEYIGDYIDRKGEGANNLCYGSWYIQASYFLTGEHREYDQKAGTFTRVRPLKNFHEDNGWGAVELAARYDYLDLDDEGQASFTSYSGNSRGEMNAGTLGVNWYLNPNVRVMANYIWACPDRVDTGGCLNIFMMRFQFDF